MFGLKTGRVGQVGRVGSSTGRTPALALDFAGSGASGPSGLTTTRAAGGATYFDQTGTLQLASANTPRIDYGSGAYNQIRNSSASGGAAGTPGTYPTNWINGGALLSSGVNQTIVGFGTEGGIPYMDIQLVGTTNAANTFLNLFPDAITQIAAAVGQTWTSSWYCRLVGGSLANVTVQNNLQGRTSGGVNNEGFNTPYVPTSASLASQRIVCTGTLAVAGSVFVINPFGINVPSSGVAVNVTLRIGGPQLELASSVGPFVSTANAPGWSAAKGLLVEEARTNGVRNPRAEGAVIGTPGTMPTNWTRNVANTNVITAGTTEQGIPCMDLQFTNAGAVSADLVQFDAANAAAAAQNDVWVGSVYLRLVGGNFTNLTDIEVAVRFYDGTQTFLSQSNASISNPTSAALATQRFVQISAAAPLNTAFVNMALRYNTTGAFNFTLRIGAPQLEKCPSTLVSVTSPILPAIGTPAATTRAVDSVAYLSSTLFSGPAGTIISDVIPPINNYGSQPARICDVNDGTSNNTVSNFFSANVASTNAIVASVSGTGASTPGTITANATNKIAITWGNGIDAVFLGGKASHTNPLPTGLNRLDIGNRVASDRAANLWIRRTRFWRSVLSDAVITQETT